MPKLFSLSFVLALIGCPGKDGESGTVDPYDSRVDDSDGDGLVDWDELNVHGTDMNNPDSDGDGYTDGAEVNEHHTSPTNLYSHPYTGDFNVGDCATPPVGTGPSSSRIVKTGTGGGATKVAAYVPGDIPLNFNLIDQYGERVDLYSFCGNNVDILFFQMNHFAVPAYDALACWIDDFRNVHTYYRDYGYELIVILTQGAGTDVPTLAELKAVSAMMGFSGLPVLALEDDSYASFHSWFEKDFHEPTLVHLGSDLTVLSVDNDDCAGADRDPCPYMGTAVPKGLCWANPNPECEKIDMNGLPPPCACPMPACEPYCKPWGIECPATYED